MRLSIFNFKPIRQTIIFLLVMFVIVGGIKLWVLEHAPKGTRPLSGSYWMHKTHSDKKYDLVIISDSRGYRGVSPESMKSVLQDMSILNFSYSSAGMSHVLLTGAEEKLNKEGQKIILLGITPYSLTNSAALNEHYKQFKKAIYWPFKIPYFTTLFTPFETVWVINHLLGLNSDDYYQVPHEDGWIESDRPSVHSEEGIDEYKHRFMKEKISKETLAELINQVKIWRAQGYRVFGFRPPASQKMETLENEHSGYDEQMIKSQLIDSGGIWLDIPDRYSYETYDGSHLKFTSAQRLSKTIAQLILEKL